MEPNHKIRNFFLSSICACFILSGFACYGSDYQCVNLFKMRTAEKNLADENIDISNFINPDIPAQRPGFFKKFIAAALFDHTPSLANNEFQKKLIRLLAETNSIREVKYQTALKVTSEKEYLLFLKFMQIEAQRNVENKIPDYYWLRLSSGLTELQIELLDLLVTSKENPYYIEKLLFNKLFEYSKENQISVIIYMVKKNYLNFAALNELGYLNTDLSFKVFRKLVDFNASSSEDNRLPDTLWNLFDSDLSESQLTNLNFILDKADLSTLRNIWFNDLIALATPSPSGNQILYRQFLEDF